MNNKKKKYTINWAKYFSIILLFSIVTQTLSANGALVPDDYVFRYLLGIGFPLVNFGLSTEVYYE